MTVARSNHYHTYNVLYISDASYDDIRGRLQDRGVLAKYALLDDDGAEIIVLGTMALKKEQTGF